jgi:hypothetical protein
MSETASRSGPSLGNRILDTVIGLWTLLLLLPIAPFLLLLWLWDRLKSESENERPEPEY